jgi:hypothetical protein
VNVRTVCALLSVLALACTLLAPAGAAMAQAAKPPPASAGPTWAELSPAQQQALRPLERNWNTVDAESKRQWLSVAPRFERMSPDERARAQQRMNDWGSLSPQQRRDARAAFSGAQELSSTERRQRWDDYTALSEDQKKRLANSAAPATTGADRRTARDQSTKTNTVPNPLLDPRRPGATTNPIATRPAPPLHQQPGLPKVAATPEFVDSQTLLPQRGAQGAAARSPDKPPAKKQ